MVPNFLRQAAHRFVEARERQAKRQIAAILGSFDDQTPQKPGRTK